MTDEQFRLTPLDVRRWEFGTAIRGYDRARVDEFKARVADELEELTRRINDLDGKARGFHEQLRAFRERDKALNDALVSAQQLRSEIREQAEKEGQLLTQEAKGDAERLVSEARLEATRLVQEARAEADRLLQEARSDADQLAFSSRSRAETQVRDAQSEAERLVRTARDDARTIAEGSQAEYQRLSFELDSLQRQRQSVLGQLKALADRVLADVEAARAVAALPSTPSPVTVAAAVAAAPVAPPPAPPAAVAAPVADPPASTASLVPPIPPALQETALWAIPEPSAPTVEETIGAAPAPEVAAEAVADMLPLVSPAAAPATVTEDPEAIVDSRLRERRTPHVSKAVREGRGTPRDNRAQS